MSHFAVLVIGDNVEEQLAPYDENIEVEEYKRGLVSDEEKTRMIDYYSKKHNFNGTFEECYMKFGNKWNDNSFRKNDDGLWYEYSTYNPKSKWDWYSIGGRWSGFFKMKPGIEPILGIPGVFDNKPENDYGDIALKKDIDFEAMSNDEANKAEKCYDEVMKIIGHLPENESWESVLQRFENIDDARDFYNSQPRTKALKENKQFFIDAENFQITREEYIENARMSTITTYAVVKDGIWYEKGKMGWWGISTNEIDPKEWDKKFKELIDSVDENTQFTLVDCHI